MADTREVVFIIDKATGALTIEGLTASEVAEVAGDMLPAPRPVNCARPADPPALRLPETAAAGARTVRLLRVYHGSVCDGPGRRSVIQVAGCGHRCPGCHVPETWDPAGGHPVSTSSAVAAALAPEGAPRDGVTITGGEPFDQPPALAAMLKELKGLGVHTIVYSGFTLEALRARPEPEVAEALALADVLVDGPFVASLARGAMGWRGSTNQRAIQLTRERR